MRVVQRSFTPLRRRHESKLPIKKQLQAAAGAGSCSHSSKMPMHQACILRRVAFAMVSKRYTHVSSSKTIINNTNQATCAHTYTQTHAHRQCSRFLSNGSRAVNLSLTCRGATDLVRIEAMIRSFYILTNNYIEGAFTQIRVNAP